MPNAIRDYASAIAQYQRANLKYSADVIGVDLHRFDAIQKAKNCTSSIIVLHYVGYGYSPRGCPVWLLSKLEKYLAETNYALITIFHEIYATGPPWRSSFWLSPIQRWLAGKFLDMSRAAITCMPLYAK